MIFVHDVLLPFLEHVIHLLQLLPRSLSNFFVASLPAMLASLSPCPVRLPGGHVTASISASSSSAALWETLPNPLPWRRRYGPLKVKSHVASRHIVVRSISQLLGFFLYRLKQVLVVLVEKTSSKVVWSYSKGWHRRMVERVFWRRARVASDLTARRFLKGQLSCWQEFWALKSGITLVQFEGRVSKLMQCFNLIQ